ncbi:MAG TPA: MATE family efflux transporter [Candidatus Binatia bacterium]|nr:MATE family efflux transporter [Candidatus Binatia bacterium]
MLVFLFPLMLGNVLQSISMTLNTIFVGRLIGVPGLAAISAFFPVFFLLISFVIGLSSASTVLIGQAHGARDEHRVRKVAGNALSLCILLGIAGAVAGSFVADPLLKAIGTPSDILPASIGYARIAFYGLPLLFFYLMYTTLLRGVGDSTTPLYFLIVSTLLGMALTPAFILGWAGLPRIGVNAAIVSSLLATAATQLVLFFYLRARKHPLALNMEMLRDFALDRSLVATILRIGVPAGIQVVMVSLAEIAVISFVNRFGSGATAAYGAVNQVVNYIQFPAITLAITASIFGSQAIGARRFDRLGAIVRSSVVLNYVIVGTLIVLGYGLDKPLLSLFLGNSPTLEIARTLLKITLWSYAIYGNMAVLSGVMRASGAVLWPTAISIFMVWGIEVPTAYVLSQRIGLDGVWIGYPVAYCAGLALQSAYYFLVWKRRELRPIV